MPTTYAHDLFGKKIYHKLPKEMQMVIQRNVNLYRIGLHGPDILFYHMLKPKVSTTGIRMHKEKAAPFFERGMAIVRETHDEKLLAYLLGFGCHYLLDSACHPYIEDMAAKEVITHTLLEKEFDRTLLLATFAKSISLLPGMRCISEDYLCQSDPPCDPQNSDRRYPEISEAHEADHKLSGL